jgi:hypothetical protein
MKAEEAADLIGQEAERNRFRQRAAVTIAIFAMLLAITGLGGGNATKEALNQNILASNAFGFFQAKNVRQTSYALAANEIEGAWLRDPALPEAARAALRQRVDEYRKTVERYESEPETGEGKKELLARAYDHAAKRDHALKQDPYFDYAEALLQIGIVLISVSILAELVWLAFVGGAFGFVAMLLMINGFLLLVEIPGLG